MLGNLRWLAGHGSSDALFRVWNYWLSVGWHLLIHESFEVEFVGNSRKHRKILPCLHIHHWLVLAREHVACPCSPACRLRSPTGVPLDGLGFVRFGSTVGGELGLFLVALAKSQIGEQGLGRDPRYSIQGKTVTLLRGDFLARSQTWWRKGTLDTRNLGLLMTSTHGRLWPWGAFVEPGHAMLCYLTAGSTCSEQFETSAILRLKSHDSPNIWTCRCGSRQDILRKKESVAAVWLCSELIWSFQLAIQAGRCHGSLADLRNTRILDNSGLAKLLTGAQNPTLRSYIFCCGCLSIQKACRRYVHHLVWWFQNNLQTITNKDEIFELIMPREI